MKNKMKYACLALLLDVIVLGFCLWGVYNTSGIVLVLLVLLSIFEVYDMYNAIRYVCTLRKAMKAHELFEEFIKNEVNKDNK